MMGNHRHLTRVPKRVHGFQRLVKMKFLDRFESIHDPLRSQQCHQFRSRPPVFLCLPILLKCAPRTILFQIDDRYGWPILWSRLARPGRDWVASEIQFIVPDLKANPQVECELGQGFDLFRPPAAEYTPQGCSRYERACRLAPDNRKITVFGILACGDQFLNLTATAVFGTAAQYFQRLKHAGRFHLPEHIVGSQDEIVPENNRRANPNQKM
jgi:hypothetical protein